MDNELKIENNVVKGLEGNTCPAILNIPQNVTEIAPEAFADCADLEEVVFPDSLVSIRKFAFFNCKNLKSVTFSTGIETIGRSAFQNCEALKSVELHYGIKKIEPWTFAGCKSLETVFLPNGVKEIDHQAFADCVRLKRFDTLSSELCQEDALGYEVFQNVNADCKVTVPLYFDEEYRQTPQWNAFDIKVNEKRIFSSDGLRYREVEEGKTVAVAENKSFAGRAEIKSEIRIKKLTEELILTVCEIDPEAFCENNMLTAVHIPNTVTKIGEKAFANCSKLAYFTSDSDCVYEAYDFVLFKKTEEGLRDTLVAYPAGNASKIYEIPSSVKKIENYAFSSIRSLENITFLNQAYEMQEALVFDKAELGKCYALVLKDAEELKKSLKELGFKEIVSDSFVSNGLNYKILKGKEKTVEVSINQGFDGDLLIPGEVEFASEQYKVVGIGDEAFPNAKLTSITFPDTICYIGMKAFATVSLQNPISSLPKSLERIEASAFDSPNITFDNFNLPSKLEKIGNCAFLNCKVKEKDKKKTVQIPATVSSVEYEAFGAVTMIKVDKANMSYQSSEDGALLSKNGDTLIAYPKENPATSFSIPKGVKTIGRNAFDNCKNLDTITIPGSVKNIQEYVFKKISLKQLIVEATEPPILHLWTWTDFVDTEGFIIQVPKGHVDDYKKADGWKQFAKHIYDEIPEMILEGGINYKVNINDKSAVVDVSPKAYGDITIKEELSKYGFTFKVVGIGDNAFIDNQKITTVYLPASIETIGVNAFCNSGVSKFDVDPKSNYYKSEGDVLFSKDGKKLVAYPCQKEGKNYTIPTVVTTIGEGAFSTCRVTKLTIKSETPPAVENNGLAGLLKTCIEITIPKGSTGVYKKAPGWMDLTKNTKIKEQ